MPRLLQNFLSGDVSRTLLLTRLLPLSFASFFVTLFIGILLFPGSFEWEKRVMSHVLAPRYNPDAYWLPSLGLMAAALLALPFAGYVAGRLRAITPRLARLAGLAFALGLVLIVSVAVPLPGWRRLHETLARAAVVPMVVGILCCGVCALKDLFCLRGSRRVLRGRLAFCWMSFPLLLIACGAVSGVLLLGRKTDQGWAIQAAEFLRPTLFWQLAFWEWVGAVLLGMFLFFSVLWLPEETESTVPSFAPALRSVPGGQDGQNSCVPQYNQCMRGAISQENRDHRATNYFYRNETTPGL